MCGRFTQTQAGPAVAKVFQLANVPVPDPPPRYNIAPTQPVSAIVERPEQGRQYRVFQWGLIPSWSKDPNIGAKLINARAETVAEKPAFRAAFKRRRCLVVADGFYEWQRVVGQKQKQPFYVQVGAGDLFGFAGLWEQWESGDGSTIESCTLITTEPNELMQPIHNRMPVILHPNDYDLWLDPRLEKGASLQTLLRPYESDAMQAYPVSRQVNNPRHEAPDCIEPMELHTEIDGQMNNASTQEQYSAPR